MNPSRGGADDWGSSAEPPSVRSAWLGCYWQAERRPPGFWVDASANCRNLAVHPGVLSTRVISATCRRSLPYRLPHGHPGDAGPLCQFTFGAGCRDEGSSERGHALTLDPAGLAPFLGDPFEGVVAEDDLAGGGQGRLAEHTVVGVRPTLVDGVRGVDEPVELFVGDVAGEVAQPVLQVVAGIHRYPSQA